MRRDWTRALVDFGSWLTRDEQSTCLPAPKGADMIITETTIETAVTAGFDVSLSEIANRTAVNLVLGASVSLAEATMTSEVQTDGVARATVRGLEPEAAGITVIVSTLAHEPLGAELKRFQLSATIVVTAETIRCSQTLTNALLASLPNRMTKPIVVIRSPLLEQPMLYAEEPGWREILAWRRARP